LFFVAYKSKVPELNKISQQTRGVVFCSVPHFGTHMAVLNKVRRWLLLPTEEIDELSNGKYEKHFTTCMLVANTSNMD